LGKPVFARRGSADHSHGCTRLAYAIKLRQQITKSGRAPRIGLGQVAVRLACKCQAFSCHCTFPSNTPSRLGATIPTSKRANKREHGA
jgi:hypothetical protein